MEKENLLLLHGALGSKVQFSELQSLLSEAYTVHAMDFEGHGSIASDRDFSIELFAQNVEDFLNKKAIAQTHIFGYSMGGYVALRLACKGTVNVQKIITLGTKFNWTPEIAAKEIKMLNPEKIEQKVPNFAKRLDELHASNNWKTVMHKTAKMMIDLGDGRGAIDDDLQKIGIPVLIGLGAMDKMVTREESNHAADLLLNGELEILEGIKHPIETVDMGLLSRKIITFLKY
ncbi:MAG: alpha/beta hydrolase [Bacteroidota bacterium]